MNVLFDNCTAPLLATTLDGYISHFGHRAFHIKDVPELPNGRHSADLEWISFLSTSPLFWIFVTGDDRVRRNPAERAALRSSGLHGFVLAPAYQKSPPNLIASTLVFKWPEMEELIGLISGPSIHEIAIGKMTKLRTLPL